MFLLAVLGSWVILGFDSKLNIKYKLKYNFGVYIRIVLGVILMLPMLLYGLIFNQVAVGDVKIVVLDIGQGLSVVLFTNKHVWVYDTGPSYPNGFNAADAVIIPYLHTMGVHKLDGVIVSHGDNDHAGGFAHLAQNFQISQVYSSYHKLIKSHAAKKCKSGKVWWVDGVKFELYQASGLAKRLRSKNNLSCVLSVTGRNYKVLLPGDIESPAEYKLVRKYSHQLKSDILIAPHHGSKTSSSSLFINIIDPRLVIFATGFLNKFGFPNKLVVDRYRDHQVKIYDVGKYGSLSL